MKAIVITSIFEPTEAIRSFSQFSDYRLIVVGDRKTPPDWACESVEFLSIEKQQKITSALARTLPENHYCRKMLGYQWVMKLGAEMLVDTDDDNIPKPEWKFPDFKGQFDIIHGVTGFINIYQLFTTQPIWPRGLPLRMVTTDFKLETRIRQENCRVGVWQGLADGDPDVDAIYRLTNNTPCNFEERQPIVLSPGVICPFNSQNTMVRKELFPLLYLPTAVTFRFTDILRGLVAQPIMWSQGYTLGFTNATVVQKRNPHDYMADLMSEVPMFQHCERVVEVVSDAVYKSKTIESNLFNAYEALRKCEIVPDKEMITLEAWLKDL